MTPMKQLKNDLLSEVINLSTGDEIELETKLNLCKKIIYAEEIPEGNAPIVFEAIVTTWDQNTLIVNKKETVIVFKDQSSISRAKDFSPALYPGMNIVIKMTPYLFHIQGIYSGMAEYRKAIEKENKFMLTLLAHAMNMKKT